MFRHISADEEPEIDFYKRLERASVVTAFFASVLLWWKNPVGISFAIVVAAHLVASLDITYEEELRPARAIFVLIFPIGFFAVMTFLRLEPFSRTLGYVATLLLLVIWANTFLGGRWLEYCFSDYFLGFFRLLKAMLVALPTAWRHGVRRVPGSGTLSAWWDRAWFRGIVLSLPLLAAFAWIFSAPDPVFGKHVRRMIVAIRLYKTPEYALRILYLAALTYLFFGVYYHTLRQSEDKELIGLEKPGIPRFLGFTEGMTIILSVSLLVAVFIKGVVRRLPLGTPVNGLLAHQFFVNLGLAAAVGLALAMALSNITKRETPQRRLAFSTAVMVLLGLMAVLLMLAFLVLQRYIEALGLTRLRVYGLVYALCLGALLVVVALLEALGKERRFALAVVLAILGLSLAANLMNVDGFIVHWNVSRAHAGYALDFRYLTTLSDDAVPALADAYQHETDPRIVDEVAAALSCHAVFHSEYPFDRPWMSFHISHWRAHVIWQPIRSDPAYVPHLARMSSAGQWVVTIHGEGRPCGYGGLRNPPNWRQEQGWLAHR